MLEFECPHCHLPLSVDEPDYKRVVCAHCRQIIDVPREAALPVDPAVAAAHFGQVTPAVQADELELALPEQKSAEPKPSGSKSSARTPAQRPGLGSGARHATLKNRPRSTPPPAKQSVWKTVGIAAALLLMVSVTAFALTSALGTTQAAVASAETDTLPSKKNTSAAPSTDTQKKTESLHSPKDFEKLAVAPVEAPKPLEQPKPEPAKETPAPPDAEAARMKDPQTLATHEQWAQMVNGKLESIETRHVSVRSQLSAAQNKIVGDALEQLTEHLQRHTKLTVLTPTRPDTHELFLFSDRAAFETIRDSVGSNPDFDKAQLAKISGVSMRNKGLYHLQPQQKPENMALFLFGRMTMTEVTDGKGPFWLVEGFAAYCENTVMKKNLCYSITYEVNDVKFSPNWDDDIRKFAAKRQLKPWKDIFPATGMLMKPLEYLTCYSMVSFLIKTDPQRFNKLVIAIREGHESPVALKMAYGRDVDELQRLWAMWALTAK